MSLQLENVNKNMSSACSTNILCKEGKSDCLCSVRLKNKVRNVMDVSVFDATCHGN